MAYSDFSLDTIVEQQQLKLQNNIALFGSIAPIAASEWLRETLAVSEDLGLFAGTEKARSEFIVVPILLELERRNPGQFMIFSGKSLDVDKNQGLNGECDFLLSKGEPTRILQAPVFSIVEAKRQDIDLGLGQCAAQMVGADLFNQKKGSTIPTIYGCVTTADRWQFLQLQHQQLAIDRKIYSYPNELETILSIFQSILDQV
jgi:hypothetical protein